MAKISPESKSLAVIIRSYKSAVKRWAGLNKYHQFQWQPRFHDHIIFDESELYRIRKYIRNNPAKWSDDQYYYIGFDL